MSDESKDHPPSKLELSSDSKARKGPEAEKVIPTFKLKREEPAEKPPVEVSSPLKENFDTKDVIVDTIQEGETKKSPPPALKLQEKPTHEEGNGTRAEFEEAIDSTRSDEDACSKNNLISSILMFLLILLALAGTGYGLWGVLQPADESPPPNAAEGKVAETVSSKRPIEKAKAAISKTPVAQVENIIADNPPTEVPLDAPIYLRMDEKKAIDEAARTKTVAEVSSFERSQLSTVKYLSALHIGGVRKGVRPIILIQGQSYQLGDIIDPKTGLKFEGLRDDRIVFRDSQGVTYLKSF